MTRPWSALVLLPDLSPHTFARVARCPVAHVWTAVALEGVPVPAPLFAAARLRPRDVLALADLLVDLDLAWLRARPAPSLRASGVVPRADRGDPETWPTAPWILARHPAAPVDCKGLAAWRIAEIRLGGEGATPRVTSAVDRRGDLAYHLTVRRASGLVEDPLAAARARSLLR